MMNNSNNAGNNYRIVVLGAGGVGKSSLTLRLISDEFMEEYDPTIEDSYRKQVNIDKVPALLDVLDTAGQEEYASLQDQWIREGDGYLLVYSMITKDSFDEVKLLYDKIVRIRDSNKFPWVLAGNKCDLENQRSVTQADAQKQVKKWQEQVSPEERDIGRFFETSAKTKMNTDEAFFDVVRQIRRLKAAETSKGKLAKKRICTLL